MTSTDLSQLFALDKVLLETALDPYQMALSLLVTLLMASFIYFVYKQTYNGVLYSKNFNTTIIITALTVNAIMMGISGNIILSLGMVGALSIIRYRTAVKDPKDTAFLFWAVTIGVINGVAYYSLSLLASIFIAAVLFVLSRRALNDVSYMLVLSYREGAYESIKPLLDEYLERYYIRSDSNKGAMTEKVIEIKIQTDMQEKVLKELRAVEGVEKCVLLASNGDFAE